jgi:hypothetical protein
MTITEPQFVAALAERGVVVNRSQVNQFRPVAESRGDCHQYGTGRRCTWLWEPYAADVWAVYLQQRAAMIAKGNWNSKRRYAAADVECALQEQELANDAAEARAPTYNGGCW